MRVEVFFGIWPPDFSQFIPDAIITLLTGLAIGFWLWRVQVGAEARGDKREAEALWRLARTEFVGLVGGDLTGFYTDIQRQFERFRAVASRYPLLGSWAEASPKNMELRAVASILTALPLVQKTGVTFELALEIRVASVVSDVEVRRRLHLTSMWAATGRTTSSNEYENMAEDHGDWIDEVLSDDAIAPLAERHVAALKKLAEAQNQLRSSLWTQES